MNNLSEEQRIEMLEERITDSFSGRPSKRLRRFISRCEETLLEMFEISEIKGMRVAMFDFTNEEVFEPVEFPPEVHEFLRVGDVFLMEIGLAGGVWRPFFMSPPYLEMDFSEEEIASEDRGSDIREDLEGNSRLN